MKTKHLKTISLACILLLTSACSGIASIAGQGNDFYMAGSEQGIRAFSDSMTGLVTTGKASPDIEDGHHKLRALQAREVTAREAYRALPSVNPFAKFLSGGK